jgi:hypothetical protein
VAAKRGYPQTGEGGVQVPRQNRVTPFGEVIPAPERGSFMGLRGVRHDDEARIKRVTALDAEA